MHKLNIPRETSFAQLDLNDLNRLKFAVYFLDHNWNYLFVNDYVKQNLKTPGEELIGKNMWKHFSVLANDASFARMRSDTEKGLPVNFITTSPINQQRLNIVGYPLKDCYFFYASQLPKKDELLNELRQSLDKHTITLGLSIVSFLSLLHALYFGRRFNQELWNYATFQEYFI